MENASSTSTAPTIKIYGMSPVRRALLWGFAAVLLALPALIAIADPKGIGAAVVIGLILAPLAVWFIFLTWFPRLKLTAEGLQIRGAVGFSTVSVGWDNIGQLQIRRGGEALVLREPLTNPAARQWRNWAGVRYRGVQMFDPEQLRLIAQQRYVPISLYAYWLKHGDLMEQILRHGPQLADDFPEQKVAQRERRKTDRRATLITLAIIGTLVAIMIGFATLTGGQTPEQRRAETALVEKGLIWLVSIAMSVYGVANCFVVWGHLRRGNIGFGLFWALVGIVQIAVALAVIGSMLK